MTISCYCCLAGNHWPRRNLQPGIQSTKWPTIKFTCQWCFQIMTLSPSLLLQTCAQFIFMYVDILFKICMGITFGFAVTAVSSAVILPYVLSWGQVQGLNFAFWCLSNWRPVFTADGPAGLHPDDPSGQTSWQPRRSIHSHEGLLKDLALTPHL